MPLPRDFNFAAHLLAINRGRGRQDRLYRRPRHADLRRSSTTGRAGSRAALLGARRAARGARAAAACTTASTGRSRSSAASTPASCRSPSTRCSPPTTTPTCSQHSRAQAVLVSAALLPVLRGRARARHGRACATWSSCGRDGALHGDAHAFERCCSTAPPARRAGRRPAATTPRFWLYSSGSTGQPKGTVHTHANLYWTAELYGTPVLGLTRERRLLLRRQALLRLRPRQRPDLPALGRRHRRADGRAADARRRLPALDRSRCEPAPDRLLRRAHRLRRHARLAGAAGAGAVRAAHVLVGRRGAAAARSASASSATSAARSSTASARPRCSTSSSPTAPATCATAPPASRSPGYASSCAATTAARSPTARSATCTSAGPSSALMYWGDAREAPRHLPGRLDQERRQVLARRRRPLHLRRPLRRHAQGERRLRLAVRGRGDADAAPGGARVRR